MRRSTSILLIFIIFAFVIFIYQAMQLPASDAISVPMYNADSNQVGVIILRPVPPKGILITVNLENIPSGFHGFHIHETGRCEVNDEGVFITAGEHFDTQENHHGNHSGDLPLLEADTNGYVYLSIHTDRFSIDDLQDMDGSAFIVHFDADNFANIPERYGNVDKTTLANGDAGTRIICGVISSAQ